MTLGHLPVGVRIEYKVRIARGFRGVLAKGHVDLELPLPVDATGVRTEADGTMVAPMSVDTAALERELDQRLTAMADGFTAPLTSREEAAGARPHHPPRTSR